MITLEKDKKWQEIDYFICYVLNPLRDKIANSIINRKPIEFIVDKYKDFFLAKIFFDINYGEHLMSVEEFKESIINEVYYFASYLYHYSPPSCDTIIPRIIVVLKIELLKYKKKHGLNVN